MAGLLVPEQERDYSSTRTSLVLGTPPRSNHRSSLSELVVGHIHYQSPIADSRGEQETDPLGRGEVYVMVWGCGLRICTQE